MFLLPCAICLMYRFASPSDSSLFASSPNRFSCALSFTFWGLMGATCLVVTLVFSGLSIGVWLDLPSHCCRLLLMLLVVGDGWVGVLVSSHVFLCGVANVKRAVFCRFFGWELPFLFLDCSCYRLFSLSS